MSTPTQKQALEEAQTKITDLEGKVTAAEGLQAKLEEANSKLSTAEALAGTEKTRADQAEDKLAAAEGERDTEKARANDLDAKFKTAKQEASDAKASEQRMTEQLAARGIKPVRKPAATSENNGNGDDIAVLAEKFTQASMNEKRSMLAGKDGDRLRAYAAEQARNSHD